MLLKTGVSVTALTLLLGATAALAQTAPSAQRPAPTAPPAATEAPKAPVPGQILVQDANTILAKDLIGLNVYAPDKTKIGSISDLILTKDTKAVEGFVIGVGGFLGIGEKSVALKMDRLQMSQNSEGGGLMLTMDANKDELKNTPTFKSKKEQDAEKQAAERPRNTPATTPLPKN
jgi:sporulation protein YlmC with PRC-barrel domain